MIRISDLSFSYSHSNPQNDVLQQINLHIQKGKLTGLIGGNGAGKTTLFHCILGILSGYSGNIRITRNDASKMSAGRIARQIAYIPQVHYPSFNYSVLDMVLMGTAGGIRPFSIPGKKQYEIAWASLRKLDIEHLADRNYCEISGGEQQLTLISRALAQRTPMLIMDEPTSHLDYGNQIRVMRQIRKLVDSGYTVLMSLHNPQFLFSYFDTVAVLKNHTVTVSGNVKEVITENLIEEVYGIRISIENIHGRKIIVPTEGKR